MHMIGVYEIIIKALLDLMKDRKISNRQLADRLNISEAEVIKIMNFTTGLTIQTLFRICYFLRVDINEILLDTNIIPDYQLKNLQAKDIVYFQKNFMSQWARGNLNHHID